MCKTLQCQPNLFKVQIQAHSFVPLFSINKIIFAPYCFCLISYSELSRQRHHCDCLNDTLFQICFKSLIKAMFSLGESRLSGRYVSGLTPSPSGYSSSTRSCSPSSSITQHDGSLESVNSVNIGLGSRSPGKFSLRGRNMKEYEEQLSHLKNENFSLKLRVYFLEERIGQSGLSEDKDELCRANMELKVETEALKKELYEKQELVRQASILLSTLEDQYKEKMQKVQTENIIQQEELQERICQLERIEPQIEVRMQEIIERDRIIEEKMEQLEHQNKILVEIQITLDEQQKQNAELEANLSQIKQLLQEKTDQLNIACRTVKELAEKLMVVEKENNKLKKDLNRKEKKIQDLKGEVKESMEMLQKSNMEAHMSCRDDGVKEMAQDEHEGLWAELELRKKEVEKLRKEKETALHEGEARMLELERRAVFAERLLMNNTAKEAVLNSDKEWLAGLDHTPEKMKQLQGKVFRGQENVNNLDRIKEILEEFTFEKNGKPASIMNSTEPNGEKSEPKTSKDDSPSEKPVFSTLENALFAHMGQKVYNTSQTFNTYVLSGSNEDENDEGDSVPQVIPCVPPESSEKPSTTVADISHNLPSNCHPDKSTPIQVAEMRKICQEMAKSNLSAKTPKEDHEISTAKLLDLQTIGQGAPAKMIVDVGASARSSIPVRIKHPKHLSEVQPVSSAALAINYKGVVEDLKHELQKTKKVITLQMFELASKNYRDSVQKYKQEICSLRKRLVDSHNACDMLRTRLQELVDFLEQIVNMDKNGIINLSSWSPQRRATLHKTLNDSRALSHSLSQSLMIGMESTLEDTTSDLDDHILSIALDRIPPELDIARLDSSVNSASLNNTIDIFDMSFDLSSADSSSADMIYETIQAKIGTLTDAKSVQFPDMNGKFSEIANLIISKDNDLLTKTNVISNLNAELVQLRDQLCLKNDLLDSIENKPKFETLDRACSPPPFENEAKQRQEDHIKQQVVEMEQMLNEKEIQQHLSNHQQLMIEELTDNVNSCQKQLDATLQSKQELEKSLEGLDSKILYVTKENYSLLIDKTNLQSQLSSSDAKMNFLKQERERSLSLANSEHNSDKLLGQYKAYQAAVLDLETQNEQLFAQNETYKQKSLMLQEQLDTVRDRMTSNETRFNAVQLAKVQSSHDIIESKYSQLQLAYDKVISGKNSLQLRMQTLEPKLLMERNNFNEHRPTELSKLYDPTCLSPSNKENSTLNARLSQYENDIEVSRFESPMSPQRMEFVHPNQLDHYRNTSFEHIMSPKQHSNQFRDTGRQSVVSSHSRQSYGHPSISRASDAQISERNLHKTVPLVSPSNISGWQKAVACSHDLCTDPSHSQLALRNDQLQKYNWELEENLKSTKSSLKDTLDSVTTAKEKQGSIERAICKQLSKTQNVLRKAKVNLKRNDKLKEADED